MSKISPSFLDQILCCDCVEGMKKLPDGCIDLTVTSPPYGTMRDYGGQDFTYETFQAIARELFRLTKPGGVVVWIVADTIVHGSETCTSARQKLYFREIGFNVHRTMIMDRAGSRFPSKVRYGSSLEYAFILSKGTPRTTNLLRDRPNKLAGEDHIVSWSRPGELVFDPMAGAGTTCKMALLNNRHYLGFEVHSPYHMEAMRRLREAHRQYRERLDDWFLRPSLDDRLRDLPGRRQSYDIIYADPPWRFKTWSKHPKSRSVEKHYRTLSMQDIKSLPVGQLAAKDSVLFLWTTGPFLREAQAVIEAWGFKYKTLGFNWVKTREGTGVLHMGTGYHTRANAELCLLATKGRGLPRVRRDVRQVVISPVGRHSEKPQKAHHRIEELYGPQRRIELFARRQVPGWDAVGDEIDGQDIRKVLVGA